MGARVLLVDNYDSFTYNLVQELGTLGADPVVFRNDAIEVSGIRQLAADGIVISPGPGRPEDGGVSMAVVAELGGEVPILGVCLGHQCIAQVFGGRIVAAPELMHGKTSAIFHTGVGVFAEMPNPFEATRYHSLIVERDSLPDVLEVTAETATAWSWACATATCPSKVCSSTPSPSSPTTGPICLPTSWGCSEPTAADYRR